MTPATEMLTALFEGAPKDSWIDLRLIRSDGPAIEHFIATSEVAAAVEWATARRETGNIYVGVLPRARRDGGRDAVAQAQVVWADCDSPEAVVALREFDLQPSMTVASGSPGNLHAYWLLTEPAELDRVELINRRLAAVLGSDPRVYDAARILRVPGTLNHKEDPSAEVVLLDCNAARYTVEEIGGALPEVDSGAGGPLFPDDPKGHGNRGLSAVLVDIAHDAGVVLFHDAGGTAYARVPVADNHEVWTVTSRRFKRWLRFELRRQLGRMAKADAVNEAVEYLSAEGDFDGAEREVYLRSAWAPDGFAYNLADEEGRVARVTSGGWTIQTDIDIAFLRRSSVIGLPLPEPGGSIELLRRYVNVESDEDFALILAWLVMALRPSGPYPVLILQGEQGSAKSTLSRLLKELLDPVKAPLRSVPSTLRDLAIAAESNAVMAADNLSVLSPANSDAICRLSTGGGFSTRALYTDDEERIFDQMRAVILNGIDAIATRQDLLDRAIVLRLPPIAGDKRMDEAMFWQEFERDRPKILGALLDAAATALGEWETTAVSGFRMADFARWAAASMPAFGSTPEAFIAAYGDNRSGALKASLDGSLLSRLVQKLLMDREQVEEEPALIHEKLRALLDEGERKGTSFPRSPQAMSRQLTLLAQALREIGIEVTTTTRGSGARKRRWIVISRIPERDAGTHGTQPAAQECVETGD